MEVLFAGVGLALLLTAILGKAVKLAGVDVPAPTSRIGRAVTGGLGSALLAASLAMAGIIPQPPEAPIPTPTDTPLVAAMAVPPGIEFGSVEVPGTATQDLIIVNSGTVPITVRALDPGGNQPNEFAVAPGTCLSGPIQPDDSCRASITFRPATAGPRDADLVVSTDQLDPTTVHLAGSGVETGEPEPTTRPAATPQVYVIAAGDTISKVAKRFGLTVEELLAANKDTITNPDNLAIGDQIVIPSAPPDVISDGSAEPSPT